MSMGPEGAVPTMCTVHSLPLSPVAPGMLGCEQGCEVSMPGAPPFPVSPLSALGQGAAEHHELVITYEQHGFSRAEAMQILCTIITAGIMRGSGSG